MIVVDASVFIQVLTEPQKSAELIDLLQIQSAIAAPHVVDLEVMNGLRKHVFDKRMTVEQASAALDVFNDMEILRHATYPLNANIWRVRDNMTPYDAAYVILARQLNVPFLTRDQKLISAIIQKKLITLL
jgi:predicted nucleic acid-binding protein